MAVGIVFILTPKRSIDFQIAFYRRINWAMEPLSWEREIRSTRLMGAAAVLAGIIGLTAWFIITRC